MTETTVTTPKGEHPTPSARELGELLNATIVAGLIYAACRLAGMPLPTPHDPDETSE